MAGYQFPPPNPYSTLQLRDRREGDRLLSEEGARKEFEQTPDQFGRFNSVEQIQLQGNGLACRREFCGI
jgi:hypothetical protein